MLCYIFESKKQALTIICHDLDIKKGLKSERKMHDFSPFFSKKTDAEAEFLNTAPKYCRNHFLVKRFEIKS